MTTRALFTVAEAAEACGVSTEGFRKWIRRGAVPPDAVVHISNRVRIKAWWLAQFQEGPES